MTNWVIERLLWVIYIKKALITGITGQDGTYLSELLLKLGYEVFGTFRRASTPNFWRLKDKGIYEKVHLIPCDLTDSSSILNAIEIAKPKEIYHLAAQSFVGASFEQPESTGEITGIGTVRLLESILRLDPSIKFYNAATSELFGNSNGVKAENSMFVPRSPYAIAKLYSYWTTSVYREAYGIFASNGILFNHESPLRGLEFVTRKVTNSVARISLGLQEKLQIGNLDAERDWGFAGDYVKAMHKMLQIDSPSDFVVATGEKHSVRELIDLAFSYAGINPTGKVEVKKELFRPLEVDQLVGNSLKAKKYLSWKPEMDFENLVKMMFNEDLKRWQNWVNGVPQTWDAPLYTSDENIVKYRYKKDR